MTATSSGRLQFWCRDLPRALRAGLAARLASDGVATAALTLPIILELIDNINDCYTGRQCISELSVTLVFVTRHQGPVFTSRHLPLLEEVMRDVCASFDCDLRSFTCADDSTVTVEVSFPPKVALARLVNSLRAPALLAARKRLRARIGHVLARLKDWQGFRQCRRRGDTINLAVRAVAYLWNLKLSTSSQSWTELRISS